MTTTLRLNSRRAQTRWRTLSYAIRTARAWTGAAWTGNSSGFIATIAHLPASAAGQSVRFRWHLTSDPSSGGTGWYVDSISVTDLKCCERPPGPVILAPTRVGGIFSCNVATATNLTYVLEYKNSLSDADWQPAQTKPGDGTVLSLTDSSASPSRRYYRIKVN